MSNRLEMSCKTLDRTSKCGIGRCTPQWLQRFAHPNFFLIFFCLLGILQGTYFSYFIGILSTLEKRYNFDSGVTGIIFIADNLSPMIFGMLVGYYGKYAHRPRLLTFGMMITGISCFLSSLPYFLYGTKKTLYSSKWKNSTTQFEFCDEKIEEMCEEVIMTEKVVAILILFVANFLNGFGLMIYYTVGTPYLDDNVKKKNSPLYIGATFSLKIVGGTLGFMLSSLCLKQNENPFEDPGFTNSDSRWIGAWWIGFVLLGLAVLLSSIPIALFPRQMNNVVEVLNKETSSKKSVGDFYLSMKKLFTNPILMFHTLSITFQINGLFGYFVFMPKYMESQYQRTASDASFFSGSVSMFTMVTGVFFGGFCIRRLKPKPQYLTGYMLFVEIFAGIILIAALFMGCSQINIHNQQSFNENLTYKNCGDSCECSNIYFPVCDNDGRTHLSPCAAGCHYQNFTEQNKMIFGNCSCITRDSDDNYTQQSSVTKGICDTDCAMFLPYIIVTSLSKVFSSTARVGNVLVTLRCVDDKDKTLALGAVEFFISIFATIPYPLMYGYVINTACLVWGDKCGKQGNCVLYDRKLFRIYFHSLSIFLLFLGACCDCVVFIMSKRMTNFYGTETKDSEHFEMKEQRTDPLLTE